METKQVLNLFKRAVREVIKEELTEILREGLQSTINEMKQPKRVTNMPGHRTPPVVPKRKPTVQFQENKWASILNETDPITEQHNPIESYASLMNESYDDTISFTSKDAQAFSAMRQNMHTETPAVMHDPETGKDYEVKPEVAHALTRDYSALMKAIAAKKGN
jgi:hypothetical protein